MKSTIVLLICVQLAGYIWLAWVNWFSKYDSHIPVPAMVAYAVAGMNVVLLHMDISVLVKMKRRLGVRH